MEKVLVVPRAVLFGVRNERLFQGFWHGKNDKIESIISKCHYFVPRNEAENNHYFKQIVPYIVFKHKNRFFVYRRTSKGSDKRLHFLYSIGIGGHINPLDTKDMKGNEFEVVVNAMKREFKEEVIYPHDYDFKKIGYINDDSDPVGMDHFGVVFLVEGTSPDIRVRETQKIRGKLVEFKKIDNFSNNFETWSKIVWKWVKNYYRFLK